MLTRESLGVSEGQIMLTRESLGVNAGSNHVDTGVAGGRWGQVPESFGPSSRCSIHENPNSSCLGNICVLNTTKTRDEPTNSNALAKALVNVFGVTSCQRHLLTTRTNGFL